MRGGGFGAPRVVPWGKGRPRVARRAVEGARPYSVAITSINQIVVFLTTGACLRNAGDGVPYRTLHKPFGIVEMVGATPGGKPPAHRRVPRMDLGAHRQSWCGAAARRGRRALRWGGYIIFINHITMRGAQFIWRKPKFTRRKPQFTSEGQFTAAHCAAPPPAHRAAA